jgi:hypothetical protein
MSLELVWSLEAEAQFTSLARAAEKAGETRRKTGETKASRPEGLFKQVHKCLQLLSTNPRHAGLAAQEYRSLERPYDAKQKVSEAYVQNKTPSAYRLFWCYGPGHKQITVIAITSHP